MLGDMHWQVKQFDVLDDLELVGRGESTITNFSIVDFIEKRLVNTLWRKRLAQLPLVTLLATSFGFLPSGRFLLGWLNDVARRRL